MAKYDPLQEYLERIPPDVHEIRLSFHDIERILGDALPASAHDWPAWWANQTRLDTRPHARAWLLAGWRVDEVDLRIARVCLRRRTT